MRTRLAAFSLVCIVTALIWGSDLPALRSAWAEGSGPSTQTLQVDGVDRVVHVTVPASVEAALSQADADPVPLVIALHTFAASGKAMAAMTGLDAAAEASGFIVAYPEAYDLAWNDGRAALGWKNALQQVDDVAFIRAIVDDLSARYAIDPARISLVAFAGGGSLAYRLGCEMPETFSKIAVVGALLWDYVAESCPTPGAPVSVLTLLGAQDAVYPAEGTSQSLDTDSGQPLTITARSLADTADFWAERSGCDRAALEKARDPDNVVYGGCANGARVEAHLLPNVASFWPRIGPYALNQAGLDATTLVTQFLLDEPLTLEPEAADLWEDTPREFFAYVPPSYDPAEPMPVVIALHGRPGTATGLAYLFDLNRVAAENGFIVVYPSGMLVPGAEPGREWNYVRALPGYFPAGYVAQGADDAAFLSLMIDDLAHDLAIDQNRLFVAGFSNGGFMAQRLACESGHRFAAFASVAATLVPEFAPLCKNSPAVPILVMHGTRDAVIPWNGVVRQGVQQLVSAPDTALFWALFDGCNSTNTTYMEIEPGDASPETKASYYAFGGCTGDAEVVFYIIDGGGHNLPGMQDRLDSAIAGAVNMDIHTGEVVWDFFSRHAMPAEGRQDLERDWFNEPAATETAP